MRSTADVAASLAYIVPTKDRPDDLRRLLESIEAQSIKPGQIIIVDGSDPAVDHVVARFPGLPLDYVREFPPSLARQRNAGMARIRPDIEIAGYLDDDLVLEPDATERLAAFWRDAGPEIGGAAFSIINQPRAAANRLMSFFAIDHPKPGRMLRSGFQAQIPPLEQTTETDWLYGGATTWRRKIVRNFSYDEWYLGHGYLEDVDFSFRVRQKYRLFVVGDARVWHFSRPISLARQFDLGRQQIINRSYFIRKMGCFSRLAFAWAVTGQLAINIAASLRHRDSAGLRRFAGNLAGIAGLLRRGQTQIGGHYK